MNVTIIPPVMGKIVGQPELFKHDMATDLREGKLNFGEGWVPLGYSCPRHATGYVFKV